PYGSELTVPALGSLKTRGWLAPGGLAVCEIGAEETLTPPPGYAALDERTYGAAKVVFLQLRT
ncbi:MAG: 16S rRNA (guanine(966)-N(2))-methyltransferase RsmD, partial [Rhodospirillaceae bacterium]